MFQALHANGDFTFDQMHHYRMAVTEREVINGCINVENVKDHVIIYTRFETMNLRNFISQYSFLEFFIILIFKI